MLPRLEAGAAAPGSGSAGAATVLIELPERLTVADAAAVHERFVTAIARGGAIAIDGSKVSDIDTAGLQLLLGLMRYRESCVWRGVSQALLRAARLVGLDGPLKLAAGGHPH